MLSVFLDVLPEELSDASGTTTPVDRGGKLRRLSP
jgi:hypothetical protein